VDVAGATGQTYQLVSADVGSTLRVQVTATNSAGSATAASQATGVVTAAPTPSPTPDPVIAAAGDIACNTPATSTGTSCHFGLTANEVTADPAITDVLALGDDQYECGEYSNYLSYYDPTWGVFKSKTHPVAGNHEYDTAPTNTTCDPSATTAGKGYFDYWNGVDVANGPAGDRTKGYYSYDLGSWHLIALNSNCSEVGGCAAGSAQESWLASDLFAHPNACTLAYWHHPRFSSDLEHGNDLEVAPLWDDLYRAGAELVLNGHAHDYERFAPQTPGGSSDPTYGIRELVVGTGGRSHYTFGAVQPNSEVRNADTYGILKLTLHPQGYDWQFVPEPGGTFTDSGSGSCHGPNTDTTPPTAPTNLTATAVTPNEVDLSWTASTDNQLVAGYKVFRDGVQIGTSTTTNYVDTGVSGGTTYTFSVRAYDLVGNTSDAASATVTTPATSLRFAPAADAYVEADTPTANYGTSTEITTDNSPIKHLLVRFAVTGLSGRTVLNAKLRLYCIDPSPFGGDFWPVADTTWGETTVTWNSEPVAGSAKLGTLGPVSAGQWYDVDVTTLITADGVYSIKATSTSSDGAHYSSKEGSNPPQLVVTVR
jgi:hypothetical protein